jgi:asparagine synthase (glutamine-hydrolysing)
MIQCIKRYIKRIAGSIGSEKPLAGLSPEDSELIAEIRSRKLTYLSDRKLVSLLSTCRAIEEANLPGTFSKLVVRLVALQF